MYMECRTVWGTQDILPATMAAAVEDATAAAAAHGVLLVSGMEIDSVQFIP